MTENGQYITALEIAKIITEACDSQADAQQVIDLVGKLIKLRWSISQLAS